MVFILKNMPRAVIFANGHLPSINKARALLRPDDFLIGADGGTSHILTLGFQPHLVIGDIDSLTSGLRPLTEQGTRLIQYPADKNETDLELALDYAVGAGYREIVIVAALGHRLDQTLANLSLLASPRLSTFDLRLDDGVEEIFLCRDQVRVRGRSGDLVSLIPWGGEVTGVITENLKWPLQSETLYPHKTRGISNEMLGEAASIKINSGLLLVVHRRTDSLITNH
jgi:thiamine pyrophosphokinase